MNGCPKCGNRAGDSGAEQPSQLRPEIQYFVAEGVIEVFRCRPCGTQWQRLVAQEMAS